MKRVVLILKHHIPGRPLARGRGLKQGNIEPVAANGESPPRTGAWIETS